MCSYTPCKNLIRNSLSVSDCFQFAGNGWLIYYFQYHDIDMKKKINLLGHSPITSRFQIRLIGPDLNNLVRIGLAMTYIRSTDALAMAKSFSLNAKSYPWTINKSRPSSTISDLQVSTRVLDWTDPPMHFWDFPNHHSYSSITT